VSSRWILALVACTVCAVACGGPSERPAARGANGGPPAVSAGADALAAPTREMPGSLAEIPAAPAPGPALLGSADRAAPARGAGALGEASPRSGEAAKPRIVLDAAGPDLGRAILGTAAAREPLAPFREPEPVAAEAETTSLLDAPLPAAFAE